MSLAFKQAARVPDGITPEMVLAELDDIAGRVGRRSVDDAVKLVIAEPGHYPALRAFGPADAEEAFRNAIREAITYAVRVIVNVPDDYDEPETRVLHIVHDPGDGAAIWADVQTIAASTPFQVELIATLRRDADAFGRKLRDTLAEIAGLIGG
jgi:hypothetical protein